MALNRAASILKPSRRKALAFVLVLIAAYLGLAVYLRSTEDAEAGDWIADVCEVWQGRDASLQAIPGWSSRPFGPLTIADRPKLEDVWPAWAEADSAAAGRLREVDVPGRGRAFREALAQYLATQAAGHRDALADMDALFADAEAPRRWQVRTQAAMDFAFAEVAAVLNEVPRDDRLQFSIRPECSAIRVFVLSTSYTATYATEVALAVQSLSLERRIDWPQARRRLQDAATRARTAADLYPHIREVVASLEDGRSFFARPDEVVEPAPPSRRLTEPLVFTLGRIGYLAVPEVRSNDARGLLRFAESGHRALAEGAGSCGWVLDLRQNGGGNLYGLMAAIGPLLGDGVHGSFRTPGKFEDWGYQGGAATFDGQPVLTVADPLVFEALPPVALIVDAETAGAAELLAKVLQDRQGTRVFGTTTYGTRIGNNVRTFVDNSLVSILQFSLADPGHEPYDLPVTPDQVVATADAAGALGTAEAAALAADPAVGAASAWLRTQPACAA